MKKVLIVLAVVILGVVLGAVGLVLLTVLMPEGPPDSFIEAVAPSCYVSAADSVVRVVGSEAEQICGQLFERGYVSHPGPSRSEVQCDVWGVGHNYKVTRSPGGADLPLCDWLLAQEALP